MYVQFWGTRGSIAKAGPSTLRFGGNTSCVELTTDRGTTIVIDCGTGAHGLGLDLLARSNGAPTNGHLLISHTHWDHIQGLPFFAPLFTPDANWRIYGPRGLGNSLIETLSGQMQYAYFPITLEHLEANVNYHDLVEGVFDIDDVNITTRYLNHPALTLGYRLAVDGATVVYASDHEPHRQAVAAGGDMSSSRQDQDHVDFLRGADLVIHDAQYLAEEYENKVGWGHSTVEYVVDAAHQAGVAQVALYHHDPTRDDDAVDAIVELARRRASSIGFDGEIFAAAEGQRVELRSASPQPQYGVATQHVATRKPALQQVQRSILIAVSDPRIADVVRAAARAEGLEIWEAGDPEAAFDIARQHEPSMIVLEEVEDVVAQAEALREISPAYGENVSIVTVLGTGDLHLGLRPSVTDWLFWPFTEMLLRTKIHAALLRQACRWQNAPLPPDEATRLSALRELGVLDTQPELRFDRLTRQASLALDMPIALVSLVDADRQWFKSSNGLDITETPRDIAFCAHAILGSGVFQVPDALLDSRFADNPAVAGEPRIRFYGGAPLELSDGSSVGTLCVIDYRPRMLDEAQVAELRRLADLVVSELEAPDSD